MKNTKETIRKMVRYLNNPEKDGGFWLPNIQRSFVWNESQIERLFDSIMREYPISTLLVWKTKSKIRRRKFIDNYRKGLKLTDFYVPESDKTKMLVLDGQQRLQSLFIGLKGTYEKKELYFNVLSGEMVAPEDIRFKFKFIDSKSDEAKLPWVKFKELVFSNEKFNKISRNIINSFERDLSEDEIEVIDDNIAQIVKIFQTGENILYQEIDSVDNPDQYKEDDVVEIFIRANSGGTKLSKSDLLFSLLTSSWEDANEKMEELLDELNKTGFNFSRDFVLKSCLSLLGKGAAYSVDKFRLESTRENIISNWDEISNSIKDIKDYLEGKTYIRSDRALSSYLPLIPLIYFRYHFSEKWDSAKNIDDYILRTITSGAFSGTPDNLIDKCTRQISLNRDFVVNDIFNLIKADGRSLEITRDTIFEQYYGSKNVHLFFNLWYKDFNYHPAFKNNAPQIDHVFPQSALKSIKMRNPSTGAMNLLRYKVLDRDQIANCMLLTQKENGAGGKGSKLPEEWFADKSEDYLDMHLIPKDKELWKLDNFESFIEERKKLIEEKFSYLILKED
ncbi:GmrSD restriction endonuclease domain-containing protein [Methanobacterium sp. ACI-7]|uniref:GmrSD restriction endonuclease domain-containing protein n=1 Tax=unclassified Methanobacterium TaxID=2627676 RepID=UPI0039C34029